MSGHGYVRHGDTQLEWNEAKNQIEIQPKAVHGPVIRFTTSYDGARELLDCLMVIFGRQELVLRYPEVR